MVAMTGGDMRLCFPQVRSLTLDVLKPEWVESMKENGNRKSNAVYEALLPEDFDRGAPLLY